MSRSRQGAPLIEYSLSPDRNRVRVMVISARSVASLPALLSMVRATSALPSAGRLAVPMKMTSSILADRRVRGPWAPSTQATASTTLDLPLPLGPTTTVMPGSNSSTAGSAKDLNPLRESDFRNTGCSPYRQPPVDGDDPDRCGGAPRRGRAARAARAVAARERPGGRRPQTWQCSQKYVERPPDLTLTMVARHLRQAWPSRS